MKQSPAWPANTSDQLLSLIQPGRFVEPGELIVIGPEKLPRMARTVGHLAGRLQRYVSDVKADINREIELESEHSVGTTVRITLAPAPEPDLSLPAHRPPPPRGS